MENHNKIANLIFKYREDLLDYRERIELQKWIEDSEENRKLFNRLTSESYLKKVRSLNLESEWQKVIKFNAPKRGQVYLIRNWKNLVATASVILLSLVLLWLYLNRNSKTTIVASTKVDKNALSQAVTNPYSGNQQIHNPILQLENGALFELNKSVKNIITYLGGLTITYNKGNVAFETTPSSTDGTWGTYIKVNNVYVPFESQNILYAPKGWELSLKLPDNSEVTLNEGSRLQFPSRFDGNCRTVELFGEAYFKIRTQYLPVSHSKVPFTVVAGKMEVKALGTEFNIKAYSNTNTVKTTLIEGSVEVKNDLVKRMLQPGQEILLTPEGKLTDPRKANLDEATAWKNAFNHDSASLEEIIEFLERRFSVTVINKTTIHDRLNISILPGDNLRQALDRIKEMIRGLNYTINGNKVVITYNSVS